MKPVAFEYSAAGDLASALRLLVAAEVRPIAGGQSLGPMLNLRLARPAGLVDVSRVADLRQVRDAGNALIYGAAITHAEIEDGAVPDATPGWLAAVAKTIAYRAVRNRGTMAGSLAHADPAADWVNVLSALGASVILAGPAGERVIDLPDFFVGPLATQLQPGEVIAGVRVPKRVAPARWGYWKVCRKIGEFSKATAAVLIDPTHSETRIVVGAIERPPVLLPDPAGVLSGVLPLADAVRAVAPELDEGSFALHVAALRRAIALAEGKTP